MAKGLKEDTWLQTWYLGYFRWLERDSFTNLIYPTLAWIFPLSLLCFFTKTCLQKNFISFLFCSFQAAFYYNPKANECVLRFLTRNQKLRSHTLSYIQMPSGLFYWKPRRRALQDVVLYYLMKKKCRHQWHYIISLKLLCFFFM